MDVPRLCSCCRKRRWALPHCVAAVECEGACCKNVYKTVVKNEADAAKVVENDDGSQSAPLRAGCSCLETFFVLRTAFRCGVSCSKPVFCGGFGVFLSFGWVLMRKFWFLFEAFCGNQRCTTFWGSLSSLQI